MMDQKIEETSLHTQYQPNITQASQNIYQVKILPENDFAQTIKQQPQINCTSSYSQFQTLLILYQKQTHIQAVLQQAKNHSIKQLCEQDIQNLFLEAIYFLEKQLFLEFGKSIHGLNYSRIDEISKILSLKDLKQYPLIYNLQQRLFPILKFVYFQQPLTKFQLVLAQKSLHEAINGLYLHQQSSYNPQLLYDPLFLQQKIEQQSSKIKAQKEHKPLKDQVQTKKEQTKFKHETRTYDVDSQLTSKEEKYNKSKSNANLYKVKLQEQEWTIQQEQKVAQLYCKVDENNFSEIAQRMIEQFDQKKKFTQNKIISRLRSLIRTGILILKQFCKKHGAYLQFVQLFINSEIAKQILQCRASLLSHQQKKVLIALNFHKNTNKVQLFNLVDKILEFTKQKK